MGVVASDGGPDEPTRPAGRPKMVQSYDAQDMVSQNALANQLNKQNIAQREAILAAQKGRGPQQAPAQEPRKSVAELRAEKRKEMTVQIRELEGKQQEQLNERDNSRGRGR